MSVLTNTWQRLKEILPIRVMVLPYEKQARRGKPKPANYRDLIAKYESWTYKAASINAQAATAVPLRLYIKGSTSRYGTKKLEFRQKRHIDRTKQVNADDVNEITDHPILDLLDDMNQTQTGNDGRELTNLYCELLGNAYWYVESGILGQPKAIWPLMAQHVTIVPGDDGVAGYLYGRQKIDEVAFAPEEIIHFRYPNPGDMFYGIGPLQAALKAVDRGTSISDHAQEFFDNSARMDFAIKVPAGTNENERNRVLQQWLEKYQGKGKRHLPGVLLGDMGIETFTFSPMDAALIEQAKFSREEIFGIFGVPMTFVEISAARAEAEAHQWLYAKYTLSPRLKRFEQTLNERLVPMFDPTERLFLAFDDCVPENEQFELDEEDRRLRNWSITVNQARAARGEDPVEWGDMPLNYNNGLPILTEPQLPPLFPPSGREPQKPGNERKPNDGKPNEDDGQNNDGDQGKGVYCPHCKRYHAKAMPPMTDREAEIHKLAMGWRQGMREEVLSNVGDGD